MRIGVRPLLDAILAPKAGNCHVSASPSSAIPRRLRHCQNVDAIDSRL